MNKCPADECDRDSYARGMCLMHYKRWTKYGDANTRIRVSPSMTAEQRLRFHGWKVTDSGCWEWKGRRIWSGYGQVTIDGVDEYAHRVALRVWGELREGEYALHSCDNRACINPEHLRSDTIQENSDDMVARDRSNAISRAGERNVNVKLSTADVLTIRSLLPGPLGAQHALAIHYGVSDSAISRIKLRKSRRYELG